MNADHNRDEQLFREALARPAGPERKLFLDGACANDPALRQRLDALLQAHENPDSALATAEGVARLRAGAPARQAGPTIKLSFPDDPAPLEGPGTVIGRYRILEQIGEGGFGAVYVAEQREPVKRRVALKVIKLGMDTKQVVARFEAERQALAMMDHPNIAKVLDAGATDTGRPYFVMELVRGIPITAYCDENSLNTQQRLGLFIQVCQAVQHAHQKGIIHRDLKPSNILVTLHDGVPVPMVIDFGIAKAMHGELTDKTVYTQFAQFIGTPAYVSPEQAEMSALDIDTRADIYSLGVLLYELLTGRVPFEAKELLEAGVDEMRRILREREPARPSTRLGKMTAEELTTMAKRRGAAAPKLISVLRGDLDWVVMKCLEKDRTRRYDSASNLANDIQHHLASEPVNARPPSKVYRFQKAWRRNQVAFTAGAVVVAALVVGIGISTWQAIVASRATTYAVSAQNRAEKSEQAEKQARLRADAEKQEAAHNLYVANMTLAQQAWEENNLERLRQVLEGTKDSPYRGFEWYYWQQQTHLALKTLRGHLSGVSSVAFSADGQRIVTGSYDETAKVWEAASGRELINLTGHSGGVYSVAFSPNGQRIVTGSEDKTAKVWDATTGRELITLKGHRGSVCSVAFSSNGQRVVTGGSEGTAKVWDAANGRELLTVRGHCDAVASVAFSSDGQRVVIASWGEPARIWEVATGRELLALKGHGSNVISVAFSPDGQRIVSGSMDKTASVWEAASGRELVTLKGHGSEMGSVAFSPDGQRIVTGCSDGTAEVWEVASGRELLMIKGHSGPGVSVAFSPDGERIVTGSGDKTAKVWDAGASLSADRPGGSRLVLKGHTERIGAAGFSPDGHRIVTASLDQTAKIWDAANARELLSLRGHTNEVNSVAFSPNGQRIVTGSSDWNAKVWEAASGRELLTLRGHSNEVNSVAFSPDGQRIVTGSFDKTAKIWDAANGRELLSLKGHANGVNSVAFSPDGQRIITASDDCTAIIWDAASGRELITLKGHGRRVNSVAFSPDGRRVATGSWDRTAKVWEASTGRELLTLRGHNFVVYSVTFSPDNRRLLTAAADNVAKVWDAASGRELLTLRGHSGYVSVATFSPDGQRIVTGSFDTTARVWEAARSEQVAVWQEEERAAAEALGTLEREWKAEEDRQRSARDGDSIKQWLVLAPIALAPGLSGAEGLRAAQIEGEALLRPKAGEIRSIGSGELKWRQVVLDDYVIDFNLILGQEETAQSVAYAVSYIRSQSPQRGLQMLVGSDDEAKVYLNGKEVYTAPTPHGSVAVEDTVDDIALSAGLNVLVFKVVNEIAEWKGSIRFKDAGGNPVKGIIVTLDPDAKDKPGVTNP